MPRVTAKLRSASSDLLGLFVNTNEPQEPLLPRFTSEINEDIPPRPNRQQANHPPLQKIIVTDYSDVDFEPGSMGRIVFDPDTDFE